MAALRLRTLLRRYRANLALVIGNGINRYAADDSTNSWNDLLASLARKFLGTKGRNIPAGIALTKFYDLLALQADSSVAGRPLQKEFCDLMREWKPHAHHRRIVSWAAEAACPLLTTNFDRVLAEAGGCRLLYTRRNRFTDYYPWETYYGLGQLDDPAAGFGIWHINGMETYHRSIRLGLTHYMGSVERARGWIHKGSGRRLFSRKGVRDWRGANTWLHIVFNTPLLILGLGLDEREVFLRWLLIERARYFRKFPDRRRDAWYVHTDETDDSGKLFFLRGVGVTPVRAVDYDEIYGAATWT